MLLKVMVPPLTSSPDNFCARACMHACKLLHICMYIMCAYVRMCVSCMYMHVFSWQMILRLPQVTPSVRAPACMHVGMYESMYTRACICMCEYVCMHACHSGRPTYILRWQPLCVCACMYMCTYVDVCVHTHICVYVYVYRCIHIP